MSQIGGLESEIEIQEEDVGALNLDGVAVIIGIVGEPRGRVAFYMDTENYAKIASRICRKIQFLSLRLRRL